MLHVVNVIYMSMFLSLFQMPQQLAKVCSNVLIKKMCGFLVFVVNGYVLNNIMNKVFPSFL